MNTTVALILKQSVGKFSNYINSSWTDLLVQKKTTDNTGLVISYELDYDKFWAGIMACHVSFNGSGIQYMASLGIEFSKCHNLKEKELGMLYYLRQWLRHRLLANINLKLHFALESYVVWPKLMIGGDPRQLKYQLQVRVR